MSLPTCPREFEILESVRRGEWPGAAPPDVREHAATCQVCRDVVLVSTVLSGLDGADDVPVPTAAQMWWRVAVRARLEREQSAARPVVWVQGVAAACGLGLTAAIANRLWPWAEGAMDVASAGVLALRGVTSTVGAGVIGAPAVVIAAAMLAVAVGATAAYLWFVEE